MTSPNITSMPPPATTSPATSSIKIHTYHCLCRTLILGSTADLRGLPQRAPPIRDKSRILPLPLPSTTASASAPQMAPQVGAPISEFPGLVRDQVPVIIEREDGYEKRWLWRCERCQLVVAYLLDGRERLERANGVGTGDGKEVLDIMYVLDSGLVETEKVRDMRGAGKRASK